MLTTLRFLYLVALSSFSINLRRPLSVCSPVANNLGPFSINLRPGSPILAINLIPKVRMKSIPVVYDCRSLQLMSAKYPSGNNMRHAHAMVLRMAPPKTTSPKAITVLRKPRAKPIASKQKPRTERGARQASTLPTAI